MWFWITTLIVFGHLQHSIWSNAFSVTDEGYVTKIERELATLASDYEEVTEEQRVSDERYQREVEANAIVGGKRIIGKLEARVRDLELELDEEKRRHTETVKIVREKERNIKGVEIQVEEDAENISLLQEALDNSSQKTSIYKRQLQEQEGMSQQSVTRVRRFQRELEAAEDRADVAESSLARIRANHRTFVNTSTVPRSQVYLVQESRLEE